MVCLPVLEGLEVVHDQYCIFEDLILCESCFDLLESQLCHLARLE
jgi:hypothetical protein